MENKSINTISTKSLIYQLMADLIDAVDSKNDLLALAIIGRISQLLDEI